MIVLGLDTCLGACSAALLRDRDLIASVFEPMTRGHQERLAPMVRDLMCDAGIAFADLDRVGVTIGPGSFTGLRIGLAFAKGLALALNRPCVGVGTLQALAASVAGGGIKAAVIDGGRGNLYLQMFEGESALTAPEVLSIAAAGARVAEVRNGRDAIVIGPGAALLGPVVPAARLSVLDAPSAESVVRLTAKAEAAPPTPLYLRPPDATPKAARVAP